MKGRWCNIIVLNVHATIEEKSHDLNTFFYEELEQVFDHFPWYPMEILLGDCNAKVGREDIFKPKIGNEILHRNSIDNGVRKVNFAIAKNKFLRARCSRAETFTNTLDHSRWENSQPDLSHMDN
jgi:hypothetical protein